MGRVDGVGGAYPCRFGQTSKVFGLDPHHAATLARGRNLGQSPVTYRGSPE
ncbi:hypothetical protein ACUXLG_005878 [Ralstonia sp. 121560039-2]